MENRSFIPIAVSGLLVVIAVSFWVMNDHPVTVLPPVPLPAVAPEVASEPPSYQPVALAMPAPEPLPDQPEPKQRPVISPEALKDIDDVQFMLRDFRTRLGGNPEGTNKEIMRAVMGGNRVQATLGPPTGQTLNENGELIDRWGVPYFFHQLSKDEMEVRSSGPDKTMWTSDDIVVK